MGTDANKYSQIEKRRKEIYHQVPRLKMLPLHLSKNLHLSPPGSGTQMAKLGRRIATLQSFKHSLEL